VSRNTLVTCLPDPLARGCDSRSEWRCSVLFVADGSGGLPEETTMQVPDVTQDLRRRSMSGRAQIRRGRLQVPSMWVLPHFIGVVIKCVTLHTGWPGFHPRQMQIIFFSSLYVQTRSVAHPPSYPTGTGGGVLSRGKARPGRDADHSSPPSAEVKNK
jgi:hypothetical protein